MSKSGMVISLRGVLDRAAEALARTQDNSYLAFPVAELLKHLEQLRDDPKLHKEFFDLYVRD